MTPRLELRDVGRVHGQGPTRVVSLSDIRLRLARGELLAVMGPSGSGKSTLLALAGGLDRPTSGTVLIDGTDLATLSVGRRAALRRHEIGYVFQQYNLIDGLTAAENVALPLELDGMGRRGAAAAAHAALDAVVIVAAFVVGAAGRLRRLGLLAAIGGELLDGDVISIAPTGGDPVALRAVASEGPGFRGLPAFVVAPERANELGLVASPGPAQQTHMPLACPPFRRYERRVLIVRGRISCVHGVSRCS